MVDIFNILFLSRWLSILSQVLVLWVPDIVLYVNAMFTLYNLEGLNFTGHGSR